jgi:hypothetical protein
MKTNKTKLLFFVFWLIAGQLYAQLQQSARVEFLTSDNNVEEYFDVTPLNKAGLLVTHRKDEFYKGENWAFHSYDSTLHERWRTDFKLDDKLRPVRSFNNQHYLYWFFEEIETEKFTILRLDLQHGETDVFHGKLLTDVDIHHFKVMGNIAYIGGYYRTRPVVMAFSFFDHSVKVLPYLYTENTEISNLEIDEQHNELTAILYTTKGRNCQFLMKMYSYQGLLLKTTTMPLDNKNSLISGKIMPFDGENTLLIGNYSQGCTQYSQGLYFSRIQNGEPDPLQWIDFGQLENFFNYLRPKQKQRIIDRISRQKEEGKDIKFRYRLLVHDIVDTADELIFVAEVFYPNSKSSTQGYNGALGTLRISNREAQSYTYTHAIVCGFDKMTGKLLWDNCLPIDGVDGFELLKMVQVTAQNGKLILAYPKEGKIHTEVIEKNKVIREPEEFEIKSAVEDEKITNNEKEQMAAWYDSHFLVYGYQKVSSEKNNISSREVFYINKLSYNLNAAPQVQNSKKRKTKP